MSSAAGWTVFLLGFSAGLCGLLLLREYVLLSPRWFRWIVIGCGLGVLCKYAWLAATLLAPQRPIGLLANMVEIWSMVGITLPCAVAVDQLVRHPAMTPKKLLRAYAPWAAALLPLLLVGHPALLGSDRLLLALVQASFALAVTFISVKLIHKLPGTAVRSALAGLALTQIVLAGRVLAGASMGVDLRLMLATDFLALAAVWAALTTARTSSA